MTRSIRWRVVFLVLIAQTLAATGAVGLALGYVHQALWSGFNSQIEARMVSLLALVGQDEDRPESLDFDGDQANIPSGDLFYVQDVHGKPIAGSSSWIGEQHRGASVSVKVWKFHVGSTPYRAKALISAPILDQENRQIPQLRVDLFYAIPASQTENQIENATRIAVAVVLLSLILSVGSTWWAVGRGMRPLTDFARQADLIEPDGTQFDEPEALRSSELVPLARALYRLAARVQAAFQRERQFLSDAAHELKTAVAIQKSTLQLLEQGQVSERDYREGVARALDDTARTERLVADMLLLSSIEHAQRSPKGLDSGGAVTSLNDSLLLAIDRLTPMARVNSVSIDFGPNGNNSVYAKEPELGQLWTNLIENAIQHSPRHSAVLIEVSRAGGSACRVRIVDSGSGISSADLPHVFERFYRSDSSRSRLTGGSGLGLSIAKAVVEKNRGSIEIQSAPDEGTTVEVLLPGEPT